MFITAFEGVLDLRTGELEFVNAGHEKPIIYHKEEGTWEVYQTKSAFVLAGLEGMNYRSGKMNLKKGDKLFLYTDGIPEAVNLSKEQYGMDRLQEVLKANEKEDPENTCLTMCGKCRRFTVAHSSLTILLCYVWSIKRKMITI